MLPGQIGLVQLNDTHSNNPGQQEFVLIIIFMRGYINLQCHFATYDVA